MNDAIPIVFSTFRVPEESSQDSTLFGESDSDTLRVGHGTDALTIVE